MNNKITLFILILGVIYRLFLTSGGNFLFNMDNARDFVDVREMVELGKLRLTGPTSAIEGFYNGPLWYYLLAIPYILTSGDPYGAIVMLIIFWAIGGVCLLKLVKNLSSFLIIPIGLVWVASNYIVLTNLYSFNPNPVPLLTPLFIYGLAEYLSGKKYWAIYVWFLAGAFFNFEMNFGIFTPLIILVSLIMTKNINLLKDKYFWIGVIIFIGTLLPQLLFDFRHDFIMSKSIIKFLTENKGITFNPFNRISIIWNSFYSVFQATMMNQKLLSWVFIILAIPTMKVFLKDRKNLTALVATIFILIPFVCYLIIPVSVNAWHLGGFATASLILLSYVLLTNWEKGFLGKVISVFLSIVLIWYSISNIVNFFVNDFGKSTLDPSNYKNEIMAIDYVYQYANGQNFKVYTYLPSVYDYPYQYLFWWYGQKRYGYIPYEYAYSPNKPKYIPSQDKFQGRKDNFSGLVFLIKEPDRNDTRSGWEGEFIDLETIKKQMVGPIEIEIKRE